MTQAHYGGSNGIYVQHILNRSNFERLEDYGYSLELMICPGRGFGGFLDQSANPVDDTYQHSYQYFGGIGRETDQ